MIFDESTNSLDIPTEDKVIKEILKLRKNKTILMIAHRLSTLEKCDYFLKVENKSITKSNSL